MNGRLFFIIDRDANKLHVTTEIESVGEGRFLYTDYGETKLAMADNIIEFSAREDYKGDNFDHHCNDLNMLLDLVCKNRYNIEYQKRVATRYGNGLCAFESCEGEKIEGFKRIEKFTDWLNFNTIAGESVVLRIGNKGHIVATSNCVAHIEWNKHLTPSTKGTIKLVPDAFSYIATYVTATDKPGKGFSATADYIASFITAFPEKGVSYKDIMQFLNLEHPTVAGRISEMAKAGRIVAKDTIKGPHGTLSYWVIKG